MREITYEELGYMADKANGRIDKIYLHWTAGHYGQFFDHYHINVGADGKIYASVYDFTVRRDHTYKRNSRSIGVALTCAFNAIGVHNLGEEPPTTEQIEATAKVIATLCTNLNLVPTIKAVMTHAEAANNLDGENPGYEYNGQEDGKYGPGYSSERWDLLVLTEGAEEWSGGDILRGKAIWYQQHGT